MTDPTVTLTVRLPRALDTKLRMVAAQVDRPLSYLVRLAVEEYVQRVREPK